MVSVMSYIEGQRQRNNWHSVKGSHVANMFAMFCVLHVLCVDAASWGLTPVTHPVSCRGGVSLCSPLLDLAEVRRNCLLYGVF